MSIAVVDIVEVVGVRLVVGGPLWVLLCMDESPTAPAWLANCDAATTPVRARTSRVKQRTRALLFTSAVFIPFFLLSCSSRRKYLNGQSTECWNRPHPNT